jgi:hypothetical protein
MRVALLVKVERHALATIEADIPPDIRQIWIDALTCLRPRIRYSGLFTVDLEDHRS